MTTAPTTAEPFAPRWLHAWAVLTVCAALPLVLLGAEVTTKQVGMVDPQSVRAPWHLFTIPVPELLQRGIGYVIEHGHRTVGWLVGLCAIVLAVGSWQAGRHPVVRAAGGLGLGLVAAQGVLGIVRVKYNALGGTGFALVHGLFAQLAVATLVGAAVVTSRAWSRPGPAAEDGSLRQLALLVTAFVYAQAIFGAFVRHFHTGLAQRLHVLFAFVVVVAVLRLAQRALDDTAGDRPVRRAARLLVGLVVLQVALGVEAWLGRFGAGVPIELLPAGGARDIVRSLHYLVGAALFATAVALDLLLYRPAAAAEGSQAPSVAESCRTAHAGGVA